MGDNLNETSKSPPSSSSAILHVTIDDSGESKVDDSTNTVTISPFKTIHTSPLQVQKPVIPSPNRLKWKKDQGHIV